MAAISSPWPTKPLFGVGQMVWFKDHRHYKLVVLSLQSGLRMLQLAGLRYLVRHEYGNEANTDSWVMEQSLTAVSALDLLAET